jgi:DNA end-binding protein Ku
MKAIWKGTLAIGKVEIPVKLYSAIESQSLGFKMLHAKCKSPLNYERICSKCKKKVEWENVVKGMELADGSFFVITQEKLERLKPEHTDEITIKEFVTSTLIAPIYYDAHYYLAPNKVTEKAYFLLMHTMIDLDKVAIATFVMREKEYACAISPYEHGFLLSTLNYEYEIRPISRIEELSVKVSAKVTKKEEELAEKLIRKMTKKKFDINEFHDTFAEKLIEKIKRAAAGKKHLAMRAKKAVKGREVSLLESLQESLGVQKEKPLRARARK